jgi:hypothetical protein
LAVFEKDVENVCQKETLKKLKNFDPYDF